MRFSKVLERGSGLAPYDAAVMGATGISMFPFVAAALLLVALLVTVGCQSRAATPVPAAVPVSTAAQTHPSALTTAKDLFYRSVGGDRAALAPAGQMLAELGGGDSHDPQVVAYTGAVLLLEAAHSPFIWEKARLAREGLRLEDKAVADAPGDLEVRFLRGVTNYELPRFLGRWQTAASDLAYVARMAEQAARDGRLDPRAAAAGLDYDAKVREQNDDAAGAEVEWRAAARVGPDSPGGRDAVKHLAEHHASP